MGTNPEVNFEVKGGLVVVYWRGLLKTEGVDYNLTEEGNVQFTPSSAEELSLQSKYSTRIKPIVTEEDIVTMFKYRNGLLCEKTTLFAKRTMPGEILEYSKKVTVGT